MANRAIPEQNASIRSGCHWRRTVRGAGASRAVEQHVRERPVGRQLQARLDEVPGARHAHHVQRLHLIAKPGRFGHLLVVVSECHKAHGDPLRLERNATSGTRGSGRRDSEHTARDA